MKILNNDFTIEFETWEDPGDYPCGAGSGPLPSYCYISGIDGKIVLRFTNEEMNEIIPFIEELAYEHADLPSGIRVTKWDIQLKDNVATCCIEEFDDSDYVGPEQDYDEPYYDEPYYD